MKSCSRWAAALAVLAAFAFAGCDVEKTAKPWPDAGKIDDPGVSTIPMLTGYYKGRVVEYWDAGEATTAVSYVFVLYRSGSNSPIPFDQQYPIIQTVPGDSLYSPFRHVIKVTVPASYVANTMTSVADLANALYLDRAEQQYRAWDAPSVDENATLGGTTRRPMPVWYNGRIGYIFQLEDEVLVSSTTNQVPVSKIVEISRAGAILDGATIFETKRGDTGFSPLRRETIASVSEAYPTAGTAPWQSLVAAELNFGGYLIELTETETLVNHPIKSVGAYSLFDEPLGHVDDSDPDLYPQGDIPERPCWSAGTRRSYFDLGVDSGAPTDFWVLYRVGTDTPIEDQLVITNSVPDDTTSNGASRRVHRVYLDAAAPYTANSIKSYETLLQLGAAEEVREVWNAPAVHRDARAGTYATIAGWVRGRNFHYFLFERDVILTEGDVGVAVMSTYEIYRERIEGDPEWLDYNSLMTSAPGGDGYSPFRDVTKYIVSSAYPDTAWRSTADAVNNEGGYRQSAQADPGIRNRPVRN